MALKYYYSTVVQSPLSNQRQDLCDITSQTSSLVFQEAPRHTYAMSVASSRHSTCHWYAGA